jgi:hypothetical protein
MCIALHVLYNISVYIYTYIMYICMLTVWNPQHIVGSKRYDMMMVVLYACHIAKDSRGYFSNSVYVVYITHNNLAK